MDESELAFAGIANQAELIAAGEISSRELTSLYLERIGRLDGELNSVRPTAMAERALLEADQADARRRGGDARPLLGVPMLVKDSLDVGGELTCSGTAATGRTPAARDCELVGLLRSAGAVLLGKTLTPELCAWPFTETPTFGITRNPWDRERVPGGSSGGSGAAVAAGLAGAALGTDGAGSIRIPSAWCGLVGLKPQRGRVPLAPYDDHWYGLTSAGVLVRSVRDCALFHDAIAAGCRNVEGDRAGAWVAATERDPARLRVAVASNLPPGLLARLQPANRAALQETAALLQDLGHEVRRTRMDWGRPPVTAAVMVRYLRGVADDARALEDPDLLEARTRTLARLGARVGDRLVAWSRRYEQRWPPRDFWERHDVLLTPTTTCPPPAVGWAHRYGGVRAVLTAGGQVAYCPPHNVSGHPACAVPAGFQDGLPRSVQLIGAPWQEATLLQLAAQLERARPWSARRPV